jgi:5'-nucleotidase
VAPKSVVVRDTKPTVTATVASAAGTVDTGTVTFSSGETVLGSALVSGGSASLQLPAYDEVGSRTVTVAYSGSRTFAASTGAVTFDVVKATPTMTFDVQPSVIHKRTTSPRLDVALAAPGQVVSGTVVVRQNDSILAVEQLDGGRTTLVLAPYKHEGEQRVTVQYLGSELAEAVTQQVTFTVQK